MNELLINQRFSGDSQLSDSHSELLANVMLVVQSATGCGECHFYQCIGVNRSDKTIAKSLTSLNSLCPASICFPVVYMLKCTYNFRVDARSPVSSAI